MCPLKVCVTDSMSVYVYVYVSKILKTYNIKRGILDPPSVNLKCAHDQTYVGSQTLHLYLIAVQ